MLGNRAASFSHGDRVRSSVSVAVGAVHILPILAPFFSELGAFAEIDVGVFLAIEPLAGKEGSISQGLADFGKVTRMNRIGDGSAHGWFPCRVVRGGLLCEQGVQGGFFELAHFQALGICNCQFQGFTQFPGVGMQLASDASGVAQFFELVHAHALRYEHVFQLFDHDLFLR
ncbi:hypothetical protein Deiofobo_0402 [Pseudomonas phage Deifobo]|nr:hypothetical protein Deiofobo_0402 [Pseudomonas phage Deifobo]